MRISTMSTWPLCGDTPGPTHLVTVLHTGLSSHQHGCSSRFLSSPIQQQNSSLPLLVSAVAYQVSAISSIFPVAVYSGQLATRLLPYYPKRPLQQRGVNTMTFSFIGSQEEYS